MHRPARHWRSVAEQTGAPSGGSAVLTGSAAGIWGDAGRTNYSAALADAYVVFARSEDRPGPSGVSAFVVDGDTPGITLEERLEVLPPHTVGTLRFEDCEVPVGRLLGVAGGGFRLAMRALEIFRPTVAAATVGFARRALHEAVDRSLQRNTFGKSISEHQMIQDKLATMSAELDAAALLVQRAAWPHDQTAEPIAHAASVAKLVATESAQRTVDAAVQVFGGLGVTRGVVVERLYREIRAFRLFDGASEIQTLIIARGLLDDAR